MAEIGAEPVGDTPARMGARSRRHGRAVVKEAKVAIDELA